MPQIRTIALVAALAVASVGVAQQPTMSAKEVLQKLGLTVTASKGQTAEKQTADEQACVNEAAEAANAAAAGQKPAEAKQKSVGRSTAGGAAAGALIGAISGNAGKGAAIGAAAGAGGSALKNKSEKKKAAEMDKATRDKIVSKAKIDVTSCLSGKGYKVSAE